MNRSSRFSASSCVVTQFLNLATGAILLTAPAVVAAQQPGHSESQSQGQVLFHRNDEQPNQSPSSHRAARTPEKVVASITDAERSSVAIIQWDLDLHLTPANSGMAAKARVTIRNISSAPLTRLTLQLSSTLHWESINAPLPLTFTEHTVATDADHTGQMTEALVTLSRPISPGSSLTLTTFYSGTLAASSARLTRIGAPPDQAVYADWDQISPEETALRGFGNVLWYPVSSPPLFLGDGAKLFQAIGLSRLQQARSSMRLRLTVEYVGEPPVDAFLNGRREPLDHVAEQPDTPVVSSHGVATADFANAPLGFRTPSLFITSSASRPSENQLLAITTIHPEAMAPYTAASNNVAPVLRDWLGDAPLSSLTLIDHAGQPFEDDAFLAVPLTATDARQVTPAMVHSLAHAWFRSSLPWLNEGVPQFVSLLYTESTDGREKALVELRQLINPLTLVEPEGPDPSARSPQSSTESSSAGPSTQTPPVSDQSLIAVHDEVYYRAKAAAVLWLLRSITGDAPLKKALQLYRDEVRHAQPDTPEDPHAFQRVLEAAAHKDLSTVFDDWVYNDRGLADLSIVNVTPRDLPARNGKGVSWLVAVEVHNAGAVNVDVPVTVRSGSLTSTERVHIPPHSSVSTRILFEGTPQEVQVNDGTIPETTAPIHIRKLNLGSSSTQGGI
ncbi:M1 family aminopeptidase [Edaphobacter albus]|uniref:M1 family aminopeptidase n=1 Tax=Edaphobacter sp. 4G125 TaxID=2763071 RepID=UPI001644804F|nr:M1 family aminopeptidase [Edaphobacter sp. 4G125]QNI35980.1 hypothetical protein H7846_13325 [Edaphobacter sp. 4G125]